MAIHYICDGCGEKIVSTAFRVTTSVQKWSTASDPRDVGNTQHTAAPGGPFDLCSPCLSKMDPKQWPRARPASQAPLYPPSQTYEALK